MGDGRRGGGEHEGEWGLEYDECRFWQEESWREENVHFEYDRYDGCGREHGSECWEDGRDVSKPATSSDSDELDRLPFAPTFITRT